MSYKKLAAMVNLPLGIWLVWLISVGYPQAVVNVLEHWTIALTMVFGSMIAGGTSVGGGAVAFPIFTKLLQIPPHDAKVFSLAIQAVGMTTAALIIWLSGIRVDYRVIRWGSLGGMLGIGLGLSWAPGLPADVLKVSFTLMLTSFAFSLWVLHQGHHHRPKYLMVPRWGWPEQRLFLGAGWLGGVFSGLVGNGIDIVLFAVMVLMFRVSEKVATPTSVVLMAINAVVGLIMQVWVFQDFSATVQGYWLAAIPVVVVGAPLGALWCRFMGRTMIAYVLIGLIGIELVTTTVLVPWRLEVAISGLTTLILFSGINYWMIHLSRSVVPTVAASRSVTSTKASTTLSHSSAP